VVFGAEPQVMLSPPVDLGFEPLGERRHAKSLVKVNRRTC
jgi:hypothetical protein